MKAIPVIVLMILVSPVSAGYLSIKAAGDNTNFLIQANGQDIRIFPDGSSDTIRVGDTTIISVRAPGIQFNETIITRGQTTYSIPYGAVVSPIDPRHNAPIQESESSPTIQPTPTPTPVPTPHDNRDGEKNPKPGKDKK